MEPVQTVMRAPAVEGPLFPDLPQEYEMSLLDEEERKQSHEQDERTVNVVHIPLMMDEERNEIVARADYDEETGIYQVFEPGLDDTTRALLAQLKKDIPDENILKSLRGLQKQIRKSARKITLSYDDRDVAVVKYYLVRDLAYIGPVSPLLHDPKIATIMCEGPGIPLTLVREGRKIKTTLLFGSKDELNAFIRQVAKKTFQVVSVDDPVLDATYRNFRIQGTLGTDIVPSRFIMTRIEA